MPVPYVDHNVACSIRLHLLACGVPPPRRHSPYPPQPALKSLLATARSLATRAVPPPALRGSILHRCRFGDASRKPPFPYVCGCTSAWILYCFLCPSVARPQLEQCRPNGPAPTRSATGVARRWVPPRGGSPPCIHPLASTIVAAPEIPPCRPPAFPQLCPPLPRAPPLLSAAAIVD